MRWVDFEAERRRAERYRDLSRSVFAISIIALITLTFLAFIALLPSHG